MWLMDLREALRDAKTALAAAEREYQALADRIAQLRDEVRGLEFAVRRHHLGPSEPSAAPSAQNGWRGMDRAAAVARFLREAREPLSPSAIASGLKERGRDETAHWVSASLDYLRKTGRARRVDRGLWTATERPESESEGLLEGT